MISLSITIDPRTSTPTPSARFALTMDQLHLLQSQCPDLRLPAEFVSEFSAELTTEERNGREQKAEAGLIEQGLLAPRETPERDLADRVAGDRQLGDLSGRVHEALRGFLGLFSAPALVVDVRSWGARRSYVQSVAVFSGYVAQLVRTQRLDEHGQNPLDEDTVELSAFGLASLVPELLRSLHVIDGEKTVTEYAPPGSLLLPLTMMQGLIEAIRDGRPEIVEGAARELGHPGAVEIARGAAWGIDAGFTFVAGSPITGDSAARHWFRSSAGWFECAVDLQQNSADASPIEVADASSARIQPVAASAIVAQITTAIATISGGFGG